MIKVNLHSLPITNYLTGHHRLDCVIIEGNEVLAVEKPDELKSFYKDEIKAKSIKLDLGIIREQISKRMRNPKASNFDDMEATMAYRAETEKLQEQEAAYKEQLAECEKVESIAVYSGVKVDLTTGQETMVSELELPAYESISVNKAHLILDVLALDEQRLAYDSQWLMAHGYNFEIHTTPGAPVEIKGDKTFEELILALAK